jgi:peptidoglycan hydrolase-like protein with peptidoglycan-binding domain
MTDAVTAPAVSTITAVQQKLAQLGYYHGQIDGIAGPVTDQLRPGAKFQGSSKTTLRSLGSAELF